MFLSFTTGFVMVPNIKNSNNEIKDDLHVFSHLIYLYTFLRHNYNKVTKL